MTNKILNIFILEAVIIDKKIYKYINRIKVMFMIYKENIYYEYYL